MSDKKFMMLWGMMKLFFVCIILTLLPALVSGQEIDLKEEYTDAVSNEGYLVDAEILYTVNKWHYEMFPGYRRAVTPFTLACLIDPWAYQLADSIAREIEGQSVPYGQIAALHGWMHRNLIHTQGSGVFSHMPGDDPWGLMSGSDMPTYKKLLPSEMEAMSVHTGRISGKCYTLANLMVTLMVLLGVNPDEVLVLQIWVGSYQHAVALAKFGGATILFDNTSATWVDAYQQEWIQDQRCFGFFNHSIVLGTSFSVDEAFFEHEGTLIESVLETADVSPHILDSTVEPLYHFQDREDLLSPIFINAEHSDLYALTKYSYQSLYVKKPEIYLKASMRTSRPKDLADTLDGPEDIFSWIRSNISYGSIFEDSPERIMMAEQVIVFERGGLKDQAVLACILLKHKGYEPTIRVTQDNAFLAFEEGLYEAGTWSEVPAIEGEVELELSLDSSVEITDVNEIGEPGEWILHQNHPNPFNSRTRIEYCLARGSMVNLTVYNQLGQKVRTLVNAYQDAGYQRMLWDGKSDTGRLVGSGVYLYCLQAGNQSHSRKMLFVK